MSHKATPEQWATTEEYANAAIGCYSDSCLLELRDRIEALEADANRQAILGSSPAPAGELMQSVGAAICTIADCGDTPSNWVPEALAAILAVAEWFDAIGYGATASILRQELQRHG
jgi:hypothetical protein